jgi:hypothetical protein
VEERHTRLKDAIALPVGHEFVVGHDRLLAALRDRRQIFEVFQ